MSSRNRLHQSVKSVVVFWTLTGIVTVQAELQDQYIGCFYDIGSQSNAFLYDPSTTIEKCIAYCQSSTYASIQNGNGCICRSGYGVQVPDKYCSVTCTGSSSEFCGGVTNLGHRGQQVTYVVYSACSIGMYGTNCDQACHCKGYIPCDRMTGNCPIGCYGNWNGPTCNSVSVSQQYLGCYADRSDTRSLEFMAYDNYYSPVKNTIELCIQTCVNNNYTYAGAQVSSQCFCGDSGYNRYGRNESLCTRECQGNSNEICGGAGANSVYSVCPVGNYGNSCARRCSCFNNSICTYRNGSCPSSLCSPGWKGTSCNIRDCGTNNGACIETETCTMINLSYASITACRCPEGFQRNKTWETCKDIDECEENIDTCDPMTTNCSNTIGSYQCICKNGLHLYNDGSCSLTAPSNAGNGKTGTIIGAVVGSMLGLIAIVAVVLAIFFFCRRKAEQRNKERDRSKPADTLGERPRENDENYTSLERPNVSETPTYEQLNR